MSSSPFTTTQGTVTKEGIVNYDPNTGKKLEAGQSVTVNDGGNTYGASVSSNTFTPLFSYLSQSGKTPSMANLKEEAIQQGFVDYAGSDADNRQLSTMLGLNNRPATQPATVNQNDGQPQATQDTSADFNGTGSDDNAYNQDYNPNASEEGEIAESMDLGGFKAIPRVTAEQSAGYASRFGLGGTQYEKAFTGLTPFEAQQKAQQIQSELKGTVNANTSYSFNPATISGAKSAIDNFKFKLKDTMADSWNSPGTQQEKASGLFESTASQLAKLFDSQDEFMSQYNGNPQLKATIDDFVANGGKMESITQRITPMSTEKPENSRRDVVLSLMDQGIKDPKQILQYINYDDTGKQVGDFTIEEVQTYMNGGNSQDTATYLASIGQKATPETIQAYESLIPEKQSAQNEIARLANIPQSQANLYFGTPEQMGVFEEQRINAEEKKKLLEKKAADQETSLRTQAELKAESLQADYDIESAKIEENRLNAKNYMTSMLAKLGALNTTGAAPTALTKLDKSYQDKSSLLKNRFEYGKKELTANLTDRINDIENDLSEKTIAISSDLSKDKATILKELFTLQKQADKEIYTITNSYDTKVRNQIDKYSKEAKSSSDKYVKDYLSLAAKGFDPVAIASILKGNVKGVTIPKKASKTSITAQYTPTQSRELSQAGLAGNSTDVKNFFLNTEPAFRDAWTRNYSNGQNKNPTVQNITNSYNEWKALSAVTKKKSTSGTTTSGRKV